MGNPIDGTDGKLGRGFMSADKLEEIDIVDGDKSRPTFISTNLDSGFREELIKLLKNIKISSLGIIRRCLVSIVPLLSICCQSSLVIDLTSNLLEKFIRMKYWPT
jgi:hypothetical protein